MNPLQCSLITLLISLTVFAALTLAQEQCANCGAKPKIAGYDFDIQVPRPELKGEQTKGFLEWQQLFYMAGNAKSYLSQNGRSCVVFTQPESAESGILKVGLAYANVPAPGKDLSQFGDYLITGFVKQQGSGHVLHMELQASCSRKTVASAEVPFQLSSDSKYIEGIAHQAAAKLSPLIDKIKKFEIEERKQNPKFAIGRGDKDLIKVVPAKNRLSAGQQTEFTLELKDCDGAALAGREIIFTASTNMQGTMGGTVLPAKVVTDAQGKAHATFRMLAGPGEPAVINAHTLTQSPEQCDSLLFGSAQIDSLPAIKVTVSYQKTALEDFKMNSDQDGVVLRAGEQKREEVNYSFSLLFYPAATVKDGDQIVIIPQFQDDPDYEKSKQGKAIVLNNEGYSEYTITGKPLTLVSSPFGAPPPERERDRQRYFSDMPQPPMVSLLFENNDLVFFSGGVEFPEQKEGLNPVSSVFGAAKNDKKYFPVKPKKVTDPNSPYKWLYEFEYRNDSGRLTDGKVFSDARKEFESATVRIWKTF